MQKGKLLIADDHEVFRRGLRNILNGTFDIVAEAREGGEAVDKALRFKPDVVLMDVQMPGMNGIEAAREIKAQLPERCVSDGEIVVPDAQGTRLDFDAL